MKTATKLKWLFTFLCISLNMQSILAQTQAIVFDKQTPVTWLGVDYTQTRFIIPTVADKNAPQISNVVFTKVYVPAWNYLFISESQKYDVAKAIRRPSVNYAIDIAGKANSTITRDIFSKNPSDFNTLTEERIAELLKGYDYKGKTGVGMLFFVDGMSEANKEEGVWVTFVDMNSKSLLFTTYIIGKTAGWGFKNNWADANFSVLKQLGSGKFLSGKQKN